MRSFATAAEPTYTARLRSGRSVTTYSGSSYAPVPAAVADREGYDTYPTATLVEGAGGGWRYYMVVTGAEVWNKGWFTEVRRVAFYSVETYASSDGVVRGRKGEVVKYGKVRSDALEWFELTS